MGLRFGILGPLEVYSDLGPVTLRGAKLRILLAALLLERNLSVDAERLAVVLWGEDAPHGSTGAVRVQVSRLRSALDIPGALITTSAGYQLRVDPSLVDADRFERFVREGRELLVAGRPSEAGARLRDALGLWRGRALADVATQPFAEREARRLEEQRLAAIELRIDADLATGHHQALVAELQQLSATHPLRERLHAQLMLALYRCGRQAEALSAYARIRDQLAGELGLQPGRELRDLELAILNHDRTLGAHEARPSGFAPPQIARLPTLPAPLLGREHDVSAVVELLRSPSVRLVTVTGAGGAGKTSLAIEVANRLCADFDDGAVFVDLAAVTDPAAVAETVLCAFGSRPEPGATIVEMLRRLAAAREQLVLLDNFEHLLAAAELLIELLAAGPRLRLLVTSRAALELRAEHRYPLDPLALPDPEYRTAVTAVSAAPATALFVARATARDPGFSLTSANASAVSTICARVDGLPLAIELAAARCGVLAPEEIARRLQSVLNGLGSSGRDVPDRQRTLRATLDWSYELLDDREREVFMALGVFAAGCTVEAAEQVADASLEVIDRLIAKSMVTRRSGPTGETRLALLEPIRAYAAERLAAQTHAADVHERHGRFYMQLAETARDRLRGSDQLAWTRRLDAEAANLRAALDREQLVGNEERVLRLATALEFWWQDELRWSEGRGRLERALASSNPDSAMPIRAEALRVVAFIAARQGDLRSSLACAREALNLYRTLEDADGKAQCQAILAVVQRATGDRDAARHNAVEAVEVAAAAGVWSRAVALGALARTELDRTKAAHAARQAADLFAEAGDQRGVAWIWHNHATRALAMDAIDEAHTSTERALDAARHSDEPVALLLALADAALIAVARGDHATAVSRIRETLAGCQTYGLRRPARRAIVALAAVRAQTGDGRTAAELLGAAFKLGFDTSLLRIERRLIGDVEPSHVRRNDLRAEGAIGLALANANGDAAP